ncbi:VOC family protein [Marivibrio halodurans]|uniref:VOC family protein n=1 Tax=Marivibrio halodurans TaxID=2039722 RepID=A0A8J7S706_9PROT|nr:VOC family protein [Marivibrio halodurans]MBP5856747.1 VOC family protein [Marivibrio halodurans]
MTRLTGIDHLAFITHDIVGTIRFYRDLLGLRLVAGIGHDGFRHYFFKLADGRTQIAFFEYDGATPMARKFPGDRTSEPRGYDHLSMTVESREDLFALKDKLEAAGVDVHGAVDHGLFWSIYFYDPNNIPLEATWNFMDVADAPAVVDDAPLPIVAEGAEPQPGHWPAPEKTTPPEAMTAKGGNALPLRRELLRQGRVRFKHGLPGDFIALMTDAVRDAND